MYELKQEEKNLKGTKNHVESHQPNCTIKLLLKFKQTKWEKNSKRTYNGYCKTTLEH